MSHEPPHHPHASVLRQRAATLRDLAGSLERSIVTTLDELTGADTWSTPRARLCEAMLARNLHQLHRAADDLRCTPASARRSTSSAACAATILLPARRSTPSD